MPSLAKAERFRKSASNSTSRSRRTYRWRQKSGGTQPELAKQLTAFEKENARLKKLVADQALDMEILKETAKGNW
jgi:hypothetical protein